MTKNRTVGNYVENEIILPSKINHLSLAEIDFMYPEKEIPLLPTGLFYRRGTFEAARVLYGEKRYVGASVDFLTALNVLISFCEKHKLKI